MLAFDETLNVLPLPVARGLERSVAWEGYGFPAVASTTEGFAGLPIDGQVKDPTATDNAGKPAILLYSDIIAAGNASPLHGFSGSPVIVAGALVGHLTKHIGDFDDRRRAAFGYVYACPIERVVGLLDISATRVTIEPPKLATIAEAIPAIAETEYHVFVSYRATDRKWAMSLVARLEGAGLRVFIDQRELVAGDYLSAQLESALLRSRAAVLLVSHGWLESPWCQQEANVLIKRAVEDTSFKLVPLRLDGSAMPPLLDSRLWLDFKDAPQAEGENLDRLLYALLGRAPRKTDSLEARTDAADVKVVDEFVANIKAAAVSTAERILAIIAEWNKTGSSDVAPVIAAAEVLIGKAQFELALQLLDAASPTLRVRQLRALVLSKIGKVDDAIELLEALRREGNADAETGGLLAGRYKALWLKQGDRGYLVAAYRTYRDTYDVTRNSFNGINAAAMALHLGGTRRSSIPDRRRGSRRSAQAVRREGAARSLGAGDVGRGVRVAGKVRRGKGVVRSHRCQGRRLASGHCRHAAAGAAELQGPWEGAGHIRRIPAGAARAGVFRPHGGCAGPGTAPLSRGQGWRASQDHSRAARQVRSLARLRPGGAGDRPDCSR